LLPAAAESRIEDKAIIDAVHPVQLHYTGVNVSFTAPFNLRARIRQGPLSVREVAALYIYDNELYALQGNGRVVRQALGNAARYFKSCSDATCSRGPFPDHDAPGFNFDVAEGVSYESI
jgi:2',3'-cyclic-nucleotide 2'-phosphodiesterase/3'-nucleotidase